MGLEPKIVQFRALQLPWWVDASGAWVEARLEVEQPGRAPSRRLKSLPSSTSVLLLAEGCLLLSSAGAAVVVRRILRSFDPRGGVDCTLYVCSWKEYVKHKWDKYE